MTVVTTVDSYSCIISLHSCTHACMQWLQELLNESNSIREYYYSSAANLKTVMTLLGSDPSVTIRFKALDLMQVAEVYLAQN